jgi:hypothetical protein
LQRPTRLQETGTDSRSGHGRTDLGELQSATPADSSFVTDHGNFERKLEVIFFQVILFIYFSRWSSLGGHFS